MICPRRSNRPPSKTKRGCRECRMRVAPVAACATKKHRRQQLQVHRNSRHSLRHGFNGFLRALPGDRALLPPSLVDHPTNLAPASGRQNHTTSPSAKASLVRANDCASTLRVHRIPLPTSVTIASRPSNRCGTSESIVLICPTTQWQGGATDWHDGQRADLVATSRERTVIPGRRAELGFTPVD